MTEIRTNQRNPTLEGSRKEVWATVAILEVADDAYSIDLILAVLLGSMSNLSTIVALSID
jgi:hypothetical protein